MNKFKSLTILMGIFMVLIFASTSFAGSDVPNYGAFGGEKVDWYSNDVGAVYKKDWTKDQIKEFVSKPWSKEEKKNCWAMKGWDISLINRALPWKKSSPKRVRS